MLEGGSGSGFQLRRRSSFSPWNRPQSIIRRSPPASSAYFEPVTVPVAPRNCKMGIGVLSARPAWTKCSQGRSFCDNFQVVDPFKVSTIVCNKRDRVPDGTSGDPEVVVADGPVGAPGRSDPTLELRVGLAKLQVVGHNNCLFHLRFQSLDSVWTPLPSLGPIVKFADSDERNCYESGLDVRAVKIGQHILTFRPLPQKKAAYVCVES